ncbi:tetratricopeptide repeat protein [Thermanaerovibrio velox DSM 12556]|uniref:Tetratricopeptide repeat protein n=1 Tax=Thermanaerovibrio velox DSM 12556 TaxID=926567 RepID=H0UR34_9BACT|nr:tetratricopeptide repeat protein [Thermanaerovibrio velox]EHM10871.1 tetratricopeptide repeat protein [Thermanaerovibrio velox DSM 12556]
MADTGSGENPMGKGDTRAPGGEQTELPGEPLTGQTPQELNFTPPPPKTVSRGVILWVLLALLGAFFGGGVWYYRTKVLPERLFLEADRLYEAKRYDKALELYQRVLELRPERKDTMLMIGLCQERLGRYNEAMDSFGRQVVLSPKDPRAFLGMGRILLQLGRPEEALGPLKKAQKLSRSSPYSNRLLAKAYREVGSRELAIKHLRMAAEGEEDPAQLLLDGKELFRLMDYEGARGVFEEVLAKSPDDNAAKHALGAANSMLGIPNDPNLLAVPGKSIGPVELGITKDQALERFGEPSSAEGLQAGDRTFEVWTYNVIRLKDSGKTYPGVRILFDEDGEAVQAESSSERYKTQDGIGVMSFLKERYRDRFEVWQENTHEYVGYRYCLKGGGLTLYVSDLGGITDQGERRAMVVHRGFLPADDSSPGDLWIRVEQGKQ